MGYLVRIPKLGLEMDRGTVVAWRAAVGDEVTAGDVIAEIESEKTTGEVEAREDGVLREIVLQEGDDAPPGSPMGIVAGPDEDLSALEAELDAGDGEPTAADAAAEEATADGPAAATGTADATAANSASTDASSVRASPRARRRADELGVDLGTVAGTGPQGSVTEADVEAAADEAAEAGESGDASATEPIKATPRARRLAESKGVDLRGLADLAGTGPQGAITEADVEEALEAAGGEVGAAPAAGPGVAEARELSGMRRTIAERLGQSYREAVHVTEHRTVDAAALREAAAAADGAREADVSVTDVLLLALSAALDEHPELNATFEDGVHRLHDEHNVCLAVDIEAGLIAPVVRGVDGLAVDEIARKRRRVVDRALSGDYTMDDLTGGTFTVSNLGLLGVESFDPVINPPQVAILGVNAIAERPVARGGEVVVRPILPLDLSFDHRVVDGADAARFLGTLVDRLEDPWSLLDGVEARATAETAATAGVDGVVLPEHRASAALGPDLSGSVAAGSFDWPFDVSEQFGGGRHPQPVDYFVASFAACLSASIGVQADIRDVDFETIEVDAEASPPEGSITALTALVRIDTDADDATVDRLVTNGERTCHVSELLREDLPVELSWERL
ncbi:2-oxo acid dehydrogenase subunit E2 [Haloferacaceae archaeon DSL9]